MRVALVLGGGGARGYAHIGVIQVLRELGHEIVAITGTSMGAVVGGVEAAGKLGAFTEWVTALRQRDVLRMLDLQFGASGVIAANKIIEKFHGLTGEIAIEDLPIPFTAVATDLDARREVWFQQGPLHVAVRASIAIPVVFTPVTVNGRLLVDGGLLNPVPMDPMAAVDADLTVAVNLSGKPSTDFATPAKASSSPGLMQRLRSALLSEAGAPEQPEHTDERGMGDIVLQSIDAMQAAIVRYRMAAQPPDVVVTIPVNACGTLDFHRAVPLIALGRQTTRSAFEQAGFKG